VIKPGSPAEFVSNFSDLPLDQAKTAIDLAVDLGLAVQSGATYSATGPLARFLITPNQSDKASVLRLVLESYEPFVRFRDRLAATDSASVAAQEIKVLMDLDVHREKIKDTLISLGTYTQALVARGGGKYKARLGASPNPLSVLADACDSQSSAELAIKEALGQSTADRVSFAEVITPLANALLKAQDDQARDAVVAAGNALESYLTELAVRMSVTLGNAPGINAKLEKFAQATKLPKKLINVGKYLGHVRNGADHGLDPEINSSWSIRVNTGREYVFVACSFIANADAVELSKPYTL